MFSLRPKAMTLALFALAIPLGLQASPETDALNALDAANAKVSGLSYVQSPSATNIDKVQGEVSSLGPFFDTVAQRLQAVPVNGSTKLLEIGGDIHAKIDTAGKTSVLDIGLLIDTCRGLSADLDAWKAALPDVRNALQSRIDQGTAAVIRDQVNQILPPGPTATPITWPTPAPQPTLPPLMSTPTPISLPPINGGGILPGGPPSNIQPTPVPAGMPTPVPTPRATLKLPVPVAAGHNGQTVWVGNVQGASVGVFDASAKRFIATIPVGALPASLALDGGDNTLVVANSGANTVSIIDARAGTVTKTLNVGAKPLQVLVLKNNHAYVLCQDGHRVDVVDLKLNLLVKSITLSSRPGSMDLPNSGQDIYVSLPDEDSLAVIDTGIDDVVATVAE
jgi:YVTN family beta-propeller protein